MPNYKLLQRFSAVLIAGAIASACQTTGGHTGSSPYWTSQEVMPIAKASSNGNDGNGKAFYVDLANATFDVNAATGFVQHPISHIVDCTAKTTTRDGVTAFGVQSGPECLLGYSNSKKKADVLVVIIHDDTYDNGRQKGPISFYNDDMVSRLGNTLDARIVSIIRPGYSTKSDGHSSGSAGGYRDNHTTYVIDVMAAGIQKLLEESGASKLMLIGQSGGATISTVMVNRHPYLAKKMAVYAAGCACDRDPWRSYKAEKFNASVQLTLKKAEDPIKNLSYIAPSTVIWAATPKGDKNTIPALAEAYVKKLNEMGHKKARFILTEGDRHHFSLSRNQGNILGLYYQIGS